jgi:hypothetical protein
MAFDTETINGRCFLISDSEGDYKNDKQFKDLKGLLEYLNQKKYRTTNNWFYNLEYDTNAILHFLTFEERQFIASFNYIDYDKYRISIIPKKELKISVLQDDKLLHTTAFYDLAQFYNFKKLETLAKDTIHDKVYVSDISQINKDKYYSDKEYHKLINNRCIIDCKITVIKADKLTNNIHNYDIKSAYPSFIANLYETNGKYLHNSEYEPDTAYSFYLIKIDYDNDYLSPLWFLKSSDNYHVTGKIQTWITQPEIEYFMSNGYDLQIIKAYHIKKTRHTEKPFYNIIHDLYKERLKAKDNKDEIELVYKVILNAIYGVTLNTIHKKELADIETNEFEIQNHKVLFYQSAYKATNMYNPVFGTYTTAGNRAKLFTDFNKKLDQIVSVNTDGVYMHSKSNNIPISSKLGDYGYKHYQKMMFMGNGRYFIFYNDEIDDKESCFRSVPKQSSDIYNMMQKNKNDKHISIIKNKPIKLKESVKNSNYYNLTFSKFPIQDFTLHDQFNVFNTVRKDISFYNTRRYWYNEIDKISDLWDNTFESRPFKINEVVQPKV